MRSKNSKREFKTPAHVNPHTGSSFDDFLKLDGIYDDVTAKASARTEREARIVRAMVYLEATRGEFAAGVEKAKQHFADQQEGGVLAGPVAKKPRISGEDIELKRIADKRRNDGAAPLRVKPDDL
jgi:hypothetical protein